MLTPATSISTSNAGTDSGQRSDYVKRVICLFVFVVPLDGFYYFSVKIGYSVPTIIGYATFLLCVPRLFSILKIQPFSFWIWISIYALGTFVGIVAALLHSTTPPIELASIWQMLALSAIVAYAAASEDGARAVMHSLLLGMMFTMIAYLILYGIGLEVDDLGNRVIRVAGYQTNEIGHLAVLAVLFILGINREWQKRTRYLLLLVGIPASLWVLWLSNSRAAIATLAFGLVVYFLLDKIHSRKQIWLLIFPFLIFGYALRPGGNQDFLSSNELLSREVGRWTGGEQKEINIDYITVDRAEIIPKGLQLALENPLGYGIGNAQYVLAPRMSFNSTQRMDTHNDYLRVLLDCGVIGLALYVVGLFMVFSLAIRVYRERRLLWPLLVLPGMCFFSMSHNTSYYKITWIPLGLLFGLSIRESRRALAAANEQRMRVGLYRILFRASQELPGFSGNE